MATDDSVVLLDESSIDEAPGPSIATRNESDDYDDLIVPVEGEDEEGPDPIESPPRPVTKGETRTRTRKATGKEQEKAEEAKRKAELKALKLAQQQERKEAAEKKKAERLEQRQAKEAERLIKKQHREATRARQPKSLIKNIMIVVDNRIERLDNRGVFGKRVGENLLKTEEPVSVEFVNAEMPHSITWSLPIAMETDDDCATPKEMIIVLPIAELVNLVEGSGLRSHFETIANERTEKITLIIFGWDGYLLNYKTWQNRQHLQRCGDEISVGNITKGLKWFDGVKSIVEPRRIERELVDLQMSVGVPHMTAADIEELAVLVQHFTKAIVEKPEKMKKRAIQAAIGWQDSGFSKAVKIGDDGSGRRELWTRIILQSCSRQDPQFAEAVVQKYKNPRELLAAYRQCDNVDLAKNLLSSVDQGGRRRYEASRRLHMMLNNRTSDAIMDRDK